MLPFLFSVVFVIPAKGRKIAPLTPPKGGKFPSFGGVRGGERGRGQNRLRDKPAMTKHRGVLNTHATKVNEQLTMNNKRNGYYIPLGMYRSVEKSIAVNCKP